MRFRARVVVNRRVPLSEMPAEDRSVRLSTYLDIEAPASASWAALEELVRDKYHETIPISLPENFEQHLQSLEVLIPHDAPGT